MSDITFNRYAILGTAAQRALFVPDPTDISSIGPGNFLLPMWLESDTGDLYGWNQTTVAWVIISSAGGGITQLTGDVTAGPGSGSQVATVSTEIKTKAIVVTVLSSDGVTPVAPGIITDVYVPFGCVITEVTLVADQSCTAVFDIWGQAFPTVPVIGDSIVAAAPPTITASVTGQDTTLTGWITVCFPGTFYRFNLDSNDNATRLVLTLTVEA